MESIFKSHAVLFTFTYSLVEGFSTSVIASSLLLLDVSQQPKLLCIWSAPPNYASAVKLDVMRLYYTFGAVGIM